MKKICHDLKLSMSFLEDLYLSRTYSIKLAILSTHDVSKLTFIKCLHRAD